MGAGWSLKAEIRPPGTPPILDTMHVYDTVTSRLT